MIKKGVKTAIYSTNLNAPYSMLNKQQVVGPPFELSGSIALNPVIALNLLVNLMAVFIFLFATRSLHGLLCSGVLFYSLCLNS